MKRKWRKNSVTPEKVTTAYLMGMTVFYLLYSGSNGYAGITEAKWTMFAALSCVYIIAALLAVWYASAEKRGSLTVAPFRGILGVEEKLMAVFLGATALSAVFSVDVKTAFWGAGRCEGFVTIALYVIIFFLVARWGTADRRILWAVGIGVTLCGMVAVLQFFGLNPLSFYPAGMNYYDGNKLYLGEYLGTVGNVDILSALLCLVIPACWISLVVLKPREKWLLLVPLGISLVVLLKMFVAAGILGVFGSALLTIPVLAKKRKMRRILGLSVAAVIVLGLVGVYLWGGSVGGFVAEASQLMHGNFDDRFGSGRIYIWKEVLKIVPDRMLLGGGPETLGLRNDAVFERYDEELNVLIQTTVDVAHNEYLNILVNQGIIALAAYLGALLWAAKGWITHASEDPVVAICGGAVLGYCIQAFFGISSPITSPFFWIVFALLVRRLRYVNDNLNGGCEKCVE